MPKQQGPMVKLTQRKIRGLTSTTVAGKKSRLPNAQGGDPIQGYEIPKLTSLGPMLSPRRFPYRRAIIFIYLFSSIMKVKGELKMADE